MEWKSFDFYNKIVPFFLHTNTLTNKCTVCEQLAVYLRWIRLWQGRCLELFTAAEMPPLLLIFNLHKKAERKQWPLIYWEWWYNFFIRHRNQSADNKVAHLTKTLDTSPWLHWWAWYFVGLWSSIPICTWLCVCVCFKLNGSKSLLSYSAYEPFIWTNDPVWETHWTVTLEGQSFRYLPVLVHFKVSIRLGK